MDPQVSRRVVLAGGTAIGVGVLASCGGDSGTTASTDYGPPPAEEPTKSPSESPTSAAESPTEAAEAPSDAHVLVALAEVPVGGAVAAKDADGKPIIVAQPSEGQAVAFSAVCTHKGCTVAPGDGSELRCPCHGSTFDAATGDNTGGPAPSPLGEVRVAVEGGNVVQA